MTAQDIICDMDWERYCFSTTSAEETEPETAEFTPQESAVLELFNSVAQPEMAQLLDATGMSIGELMMILMDLELRGVIRTLPGQRYERI